MMSPTAELAVKASNMTIEEDDLKSSSARSPSPVPTAASSCSEHSLEVDMPSPVPPNTACAQRKLSAALVTDPRARHDLLNGRPRIVVPSSSPSTEAKATQQKKKKKDYSSSDFALFPPALRSTAWSEAVAPDFNVRSVNYMTDQKKQPSEPALFQLLTADLVKVDEPIFTGLCSHPTERIQTALRKEQETGVRELPEFIFAVNLCIPGKCTYHWVAYFGIDDVSVLKDPNTPVGRLAQPFFFGDSDEYRNQTFKLIPRIVKGNVVVRKAVGSKPSILGSKLKQYYIQHDRFFELVVDIGSEKMAQRIVRLAQGYAKSLVVDMMFVLEGTNEKTLPERILGGARVSNLDFKQKDGQRKCTSPAP